MSKKQSRSTQRALEKALFGKPSQPAVKRTPLMSRAEARAAAWVPFLDRTEVLEAHRNGDDDHEPA